MFSICQRTLLKKVSDSSIRFELPEINEFVNRNLVEGFCYSMLAYVSFLEAAFCKRGANVYD